MHKYEAHNQRMRRAICEAMIRLLSEKPFMKITVQDLIDCAQIQRATFYRYFRDKFEVAEVINRWIAEHLAQRFLESFDRNAHPFDYKEHILFSTQFHPVIDAMMPVHIENIDLQRNLLDAFSRLYLSRFPDSDELEVYLASHSFLSVVTWVWEKDPEKFDHQLFSEAQVRWQTRLYHSSSQVQPEPSHHLLQESDS